MHTIRSLPGFALALAIGYAAGVLMCVDAYHLGQSNAVKDGLTGARMNCLPRRRGPAGSTLAATADPAVSQLSVGGADVCPPLPSEHTQ
jgi:hypothetical protein